ncbi:hypothetical protein HUW51_11595 [Adhaeribacter swui]|uniref:Uncharacterized protein n=1 Tax=Adhaeribacter swui TaxID=2086471 RepID=A0A7G7G852_9BACT|nr:hypothetical protein [Adhaeribacter swui]QNF33336.1 hypothetical protein HUW51_11595 [Adhaeribacter swui]
MEFISLTLFVLFLVLLHKKASMFGLAARLEPVPLKPSFSNQKVDFKKKPMLDF